MASSVASGDVIQNNSPQSGGKKSNLNGRSLQIVKTLDDHSFELDEAALEEILLDPRVRDKKVVVLSVAGAFRKGKSFFLDFCLRYLHAQGLPEWLGDEKAALEGFSWRGGADRDTTGILMWSEPFLQMLPTGEQVAVLLMDTQGAFDSVSTVKDCATVFALSTLLSSVQVYNIMLNIQEDDLQHLQLFTEYGRLALEDNGAKPFQNLTFLVRDWQYPYEFEYGSDGGDRLLEKRLQVTETTHSELQQLRQHIRSCFNRLSCCLMPHPGLKVATNPRFDGRLSDISLEFKDELKKIIPRLLSRDNLVIKQINGSKITGRELVEYFKAYIKMYQGDELPEPKSMLLATAEANNLTAVASAKDFYSKEMEQICGGDKPYIGPELLIVQHTRCRNAALHQFNSTRKMGGAEFCQSYRDRLEAELADLYDQYLKHNESKNLFAAAKTPAVLFTISVGLYIASGLLAMLGLTPFANLVNLAMLVVLSVLGAWVYVRYTGEYREVGVFIDQLADTAWEGALGPVWMRIMQGGASHAIQHKTGVSLPSSHTSNNNKKNS